MLHSEPQPQRERGGSRNVCYSSSTVGGCGASVQGVGRSGAPSARGASASPCACAAGGGPGCSCALDGLWTDDCDCNSRSDTNYQHGAADGTGTADNGAVEAHGHTSQEFGVHGDSGAGAFESHLRPMLDLYEFHSGEVLPKHSGAAVDMPRFEPLAGVDVPEPYRSLLVHNRNMTPTLAEFHGSHMGLRVLHRYEDEETGVLSRWVLLLTADERPVELGAIRIHLRNLPEDVADLVRRGEKPLGGLLLQHEVRQTCSPRLFFRVKQDRLLSCLLELPDKPGAGVEASRNETAVAHDSEVLFGRCNIIYNGTGNAIAQVVEILPCERND